MKYRALGRTGFQVSDIAHGLWGMSGWSESNDDESRQAIQLAIDLGCNLFDTAWAYGDGKSDGLLGEALTKNKGKRIYAASKIPPKNLRWPASPKDKYTDVFPADHVFKYANRIREKLKSDSIDILQLHVWDDSWTDHPEFRSTVEKLKNDGVIRFFGLSLNRWEPENGLKAIRTGLVDVVQVIYNIFDQAPEDKLFPLCQELNIGVIARVPLDEGSLGGKMTAQTKFPLERLARPLLRPRESRCHPAPRRLPQADHAPRHDPARDVLALCHLSPGSQYDHHRHAQARSRPPEHGPERRRATRCSFTDEGEVPPVGSPTAALVGLAAHPGWHARLLHWLRWDSRPRLSGGA